MDNQKRGEELNQLSRLLFDQAASKWYWAIGIEVVAAAIGITAQFLTLSDDSKLGFAIFGLILLGISYFLRLRFEDEYDVAETMRRQSVLTEGLGWPIGKTQFSKWRQKAGKKLLEKFKLQPRNDGYYVTNQKTGTPRKLLEMTIESAFWTRHLYKKLQRIVWIIFFIILVISILVISLSITSFFPINSRTQIVYAIYLFLPVMLTIDVLGWALRLGRLADSICEVEEGLERLEEQKPLTEQAVMRWISEYNCQVTSGFPIPPILFKFWHDEIKELWERR